jgi:hypothetical protein
VTKKPICDNRLSASTVRPSRIKTDPTSQSWITTPSLLDGLLEFDDGAWNSFVARFEVPLVGYARQMGVQEAEAGVRSPQGLGAGLAVQHRPPPASRHGARSSPD